MKQKKPLDGIRVIELANYVAAPIVCRICADLGAEVIKIEGRGGDAWRATSIGHTKTGYDENPLFDIFNVGKKSISLNMKTDEGKALAEKIKSGEGIPKTQHMEIMDEINKNPDIAKTIFNLLKG